MLFWKIITGTRIISLSKFIIHAYLLFSLIDFFQFSISNKPSKASWYEATTLLYSQFWESENWAELSKSSISLMHNDYGLKLLETAAHLWSLASVRWVPSFICTSACWGEMSKCFFTHMSGNLGWETSKS